MRSPASILGLIATAGFALAVTDARACSVKDRAQTPQARWLSTRAKIDSAAAVIDGEVITPFKDDRHPAVVRAWRVFKGPRKAEFLVGRAGPCGWTLDQAGVRARLFLDGGPGTYVARMNNGREELEDRILGSDRRKDWPFRSP